MGFREELALARMWNAGARRQVVELGGLSLRDGDTVRAPRDTERPPHSAVAWLGDWKGSAAEDVGVRRRRRRGWAQPPACVPPAATALARLGPLRPWSAPFAGDAAGLRWGHVDWVRLPVRDSQKSHRRRGLPAPPGGSGGVASGLLAHGHWEGRSLPTGVRLSPGSRTTAGLGQASPLWQRPRHRAALVTGCRAPGLGAASVGGRERQPDLPARATEPLPSRR